MYEYKHIGPQEAAKFIGVGKNKILQLCQERPHNFPAVRVGRCWRIDKEKLSVWYDAWYSGKFEI